MKTSPTRRIPVTVTLPPAIVDEIDQLAEARERSRSQTLAIILREHFARRQEGAPPDAADR